MITQQKVIVAVMETDSAETDMYNFTVMHRNEQVARVQVSDDHLSPEAIVMVSGSSIGTQRKYYDKGYWYKQNRNGYEGRAEYLAAVVLSCSNIDDYVEYECCKINGIDGCRSLNFLGEGDSYISLQRLYDIYHGGQLSERIRLYDNVSERIDFVVEFTENLTGLNIREYLGKLLTLDMLIVNVDRHFNNIGIIANSIEGRYRPAPVFDNGNSLLSNLGRYDHEDSLAGNIEKATGHPFCANLERQAMELGFGLKINYGELQSKLDSEPDSRALEVLRMQLRKYESIVAL